MKAILIATGAVFLMATTTSFAQPAGAPARPNALIEFPATSGAKLTVTTPAWTDSGDIPYENTQYRGNVFPGLAWTPGPSGTQSYVVIMQDTGAIVRGAPILHWTLYNIPASVTKLDAGMPATGNPPGSSYGPNIRAAAQPYMGPRTVEANTTAALSTGSSQTAASSRSFATCPPRRATPSTTGSWSRSFRQRSSTC